MNEKMACQQYGKKYFHLLKRNPWIQTYRKTKQSWDIEIDGLWLPSLFDLWVMTEQYSVNKEIILKHRGKPMRYFEASYCKVKTKGSTPEEAMLQLFIYLESPTLSPEKKKEKIG